MRHAFASFITFIAIRCRIWVIWSKLYRFLYERKYRNYNMPFFSTFGELEATLAQMKWRKDGPMELMDAASLPQATYGRFKDGKAAGDCEDISLFAATSIYFMKASLLVAAGSMINDVYLLTVIWEGSGSKIVEGHSVCVFSYKAEDGIKWAWVSNWYGGKIQWERRNIGEIVARMMDEKKLVRWALSTCNLKLVDSGTRLP